METNHEGPAALCVEDDEEVKPSITRTSRVVTWHGCNEDEPFFSQFNANAKPFCPRNADAETFFPSPADTEPSRAQAPIPNGEAPYCCLYLGPNVWSRWSDGVLNGARNNLEPTSTADEMGMMCTKRMKKIHEGDGSPIAAKFDFVDPAWYGELNHPYPVPHDSHVDFDARSQLDVDAIGLTHDPMVSTQCRVSAELPPSWDRVKTMKVQALQARIAELSQVLDSDGSLYDSCDWLEAMQYAVQMDIAGLL